MRSQRSTYGFTLIELLIVVAIIAILAAIAVPNFLEAQVRSKVGRAKADIRALTTALESYRIDGRDYPPAYTNATGLPWLGYDTLIVMTSPVAYISSIPRDPFLIHDPYNPANTSNGPGPYYYWNIPVDDPNFGLGKGYVRHASWRLAGAGPDQKHGVAGLYGDTVYELNWIDYDPTNGTISRGEVMRWGP